jgi:prepilin signal peptidase PulO-like enzyme (type II secretory pathway)
MNWLNLLPSIGHATLGFGLGAILGSFLNALSYRLPRGISIVRPRSSCPSCLHVLGIADLIPLGSYLWSQGRCRHCGVAFGRRYFTIELAMASATALVFALLWGNWFMLPIMAMLSTGLCRAVMRLEKPANPH